jgi:hypothetical protein
MFLTDLKTLKIRWDLTPAKAEKSSLEGWYFIVDVWGSRPSLAVICKARDNSRLHRILDYEDHGITHKVLVKAVEDAGGSVKKPGRYPINADLGVKLWSIVGK